MRISLQVVSEEDIALLRRTVESWSGEDKSQWYCLLAQLRQHERLGFLYDRLVSNKNPIPFRSLLRIIERHGVNCIVVEHPYLDVEFWDAYAHFHSRSFREQPKRGWRLHFFRATKPNANLLPEMLYNGKNQQELEQKGFSYYGFATVRPTSSFNLGRVAVPFDLFDEGRSIFLKGQGKQFAHVAASQLDVETVPFIQQDPVAGVCATASMWVASHVLATKFDLHKYPYIAITRRAMRNGSHDSGGGGLLFDEESLDRGLTAQAICDALSITGANPVCFMTRDLADPGRVPAVTRDLIYTFVESELPVIVCLAKPDVRGGHAVAVIGHLQSRICDSSEMKKCTVAEVCSGKPRRHFLVSQAVSSFYAHDDRYGPFNRLEFSLECPDCRYLCPVLIEEPDSDKPQWSDIRALIVPMPPYVKNSPQNIVRDAWFRFTRVFGGLLNPEDRVLWRIFLVNGSRFKQSLVKRYPRKVTRQYGEIHLPKYIWLCEISIFQERDFERFFNADSTHPRPVCGEFIYDTTTPFYETLPIVQRFREYLVTDIHSDIIPSAAMQENLEKSKIPDYIWDGESNCFTGSPQI